MKLSNKILISFLVVGAVFLAAEKLAERAAFENRQKLEFEPGIVEKPVEPFKVIVFDSKLDANSQIRIAKGDRFRVGSDQNFWNAVEFSQRGDTIFVNQKTEKIGKLDDESSRSINKYANFYVVCPGNLSAIHSDIGIKLTDFSSELIHLAVKPDEREDGKSIKDCEIELKNCSFGNLRIQTEREVECTLDKNSSAENLFLEIGESSSANILGTVKNNIEGKIHPKTRINLLGENLGKLKSM
jgi:hypothetical protein